MQRTVVCSLVFVFCLALAAQDPGRVIGEVTAIDAAGQTLTVKTDAGATTTVSLTARTLYLRVPPGEKDLHKAAKITLADLAAGDRVLARGTPATAVIVMTKADLAQKHESEREDWQKRGVAGTITALNPQSSAITLRVGSMQAAKTITVVPAENAVYRRYAPDSVRFSDARPSSFADLKPGDQARVLGDKNADGTQVKAEQIVSGSFRTIPGQIKAVDAAGGEIRMTDLASKKPMVVHVKPDSMVRRLPPMVATMMARRFNAHAGGSPEHPPASSPGPAHQWPAGPGGESGGMRRPGGGDLQQMLERMPAVALNELKPGDAVIVSSTNGADPSEVTAITLVAGVEPLLTAAPNGGQQIGGEWTLDIGVPGMAGEQ